MSATATKLSRVVSWKDLETWQQDNEYILRGYRRAKDDFWSCVGSIFGYVHNETVNIHSHLGGALLFAFLLTTFQSTYLSQYKSVSLWDVLVFAIFLVSAVFCLIFSAVYHTSLSHSEKVADFFHAFDYAGIVVLTVGSFYPCIYYAFFCEPYLQFLYLTTITIAGCGAAYIVLSPEYSKPTHRGARTAVFVGLGLCAIFPVTHAMVSHGFSQLTEDLGFKWLLLSGALYVSGALIYANRIPERFAPGRFDYVFASHQIFHFNVIMAAIAHYACVITAFRHTHGEGPGLTLCK